MKKLMLSALFAVCAPAAVSAMQDAPTETPAPETTATSKKCCVKCACDKMSNGVNYLKGTRLVQFATATKVRKAVTGALLVATAAVVVKKALAKNEKSESKN